MISLWSIVKLTARAAFRSHIFQLLLGLLLICVFLIPSTISGDGTAYGYIRISLKYSLTVVTFILSLSTVWLGCFSLSSDIENYQLHMVISKPVSRVKIWIGKWLGVVMIHLALLLVAGMAIYLMVLWQFSRQSFTEQEKARIEAEVMVGRRVFTPERPDINALARQMLARRLEELEGAGRSRSVNINEAAGLAEMRNRVMTMLSEVQPGEAGMRIWKFNNIPRDLQQPLFLRFRMYVNKVSSKDQRLSRGLWLIMGERETDEIRDGRKVTIPVLFPTASYPQQYMTGVFHELAINPGFVLNDYSVQVAFINFDPEAKPLFFQLSDGPRLLVKSSGFFGNFMRALLVCGMQLTILAGLAAAAACVLSMPTAVFMVFSYLLFGVFAQFLVGGGTESASEGIGSFIGYWVSRFLLLIIIPMQNFEISHFIANGELIEASYVGNLFLRYFIFKAMPLFLLGIFLYRRREMGLVVRK